MTSDSVDGYCVIPSGFEQRQVINYLVNSLHVTEEAIESISKCKDVFVLSNLVDKRIEIDNGFIDSYWIDIIEYVLEVHKQENIRTYHLVVGMDTNEQVLKKEIRKYFHEESIYLDVFREGWLMRDETIINLE
ncbi:hypothetical protein AAH971_00390 [Enterococcus faecalis]|uniref:hypothetical protein n=1 Tax=Enterococcus faecalis TaxID=1351 RepID=UPI0031CD492F